MIPETYIITQHNAAESGQTSPHYGHALHPHPPRIMVGYYLFLQRHKNHVYFFSRVRPSRLPPSSIIRLELSLGGDHG